MASRARAMCRACPWPNDKAGQRVLVQHAPELAEFYEKSAKDRYGFEQSLRDEEAARNQMNRLESEYSEQIHAQNIFADPTSLETDKADFVTKFPARAKIYQREALPVRATVFGRGRNQTTRGKVFKTDPGLWKVVELAEKHNADLEKEAERTAEAEREQAEARLAELRHKIVRLDDGRQITLAK